MVLLFVGACALLCAALAWWRAPRLPRDIPLLALAAAPQLLMFFDVRQLGLMLLSAGALMLWCYRNRAIAGLPAVALGIAMNMLPIAWHGGAMPIHTATLAQIGVSAAPDTALAGSKDVAVLASPLGFLADWIVLPVGTSALVFSPGDGVLIFGVIVWILFDNSREKVYSMLNTRTIEPEVCAQLIPGQSARPALTRLALLAAANPTVAESLLRDTLDIAVVHPHYAFVLDARDRATLESIRSQSSTVGEFLSGLADAVDGAT